MFDLMLDMDIDIKKWTK